MWKLHKTKEEYLMEYLFTNLYCRDEALKGIDYTAPSKKLFNLGTAGPGMFSFINTEILLIEKIFHTLSGTMNKRIEMKHYF